jgi:hypothetical protein
MRSRTRDPVRESASNPRNLARKLPRSTVHKTLISRSSGSAATTRQCALQQGVVVVQTSLAPTAARSTCATSRSRPSKGTTPKARVPKDQWRRCKNPLFRTHTYEAHTSISSLTPAHPRRAALGSSAEGSASAAPSRSVVSSVAVAIGHERAIGSCTGLSAAASGRSAAVSERASAVPNRSGFFVPTTSVVRLIADVPLRAVGSSRLICSSAQREFANAQLRVSTFEASIPAASILAYLTEVLDR